MTTQSRYSTVAIILHWVLAGLILFMIWLGHNMEGQEDRYQLHKSIGITLLVLTIARIIWRFYNKPPPLPDDVKPYEAKLSKLVQFGFYALMLLIPLGGWIMVSVAPFSVKTVLFGTISWPSFPLAQNEQVYKLLSFMHGKGATIGFLGLLLLHVAGAVKHEIGHESGVLKRILPGRNGRAAPSKGMTMTLLGSLGFFVLVAAIPVISSSSLSKNTSRVVSTPNPDANWAVISDESQITFDFSHDGADYTGTFNDWTASIFFDDNDLESSLATVTVDLMSVDASTKFYNDNLKAAEWFDVKTLSSAQVVLDNFNRVGEPGRYVAEARLTLKGATVTAPLSFDLQINGDTATMTGTTTLTRKGLNLGQDSDPDGDWVGEEIIVNVSLVAERI